MKKQLFRGLDAGPVSRAFPGDIPQQHQTTWSKRRKEGNTMNRNKLALKRTSKCHYMAPPRVAAVENDNISNQRQVVPVGRRSFLLAIPLMLAAVVPVAAQDSDFGRS